MCSLFLHTSHIIRISSFSHPTTTPPRINTIISLSSIRVNRRSLFRSLAPGIYRSPFEPYKEGATCDERN